MALDLVDYSFASVYCQNQLCISMSKASLLQFKKGSPILPQSLKEERHPFFCHQKYHLFICKIFEDG